jgi:prepilin-type N-terminal cleavage/methylation domain-containing protein
MRTNLAKRLKGKTAKSLSNRGFTLMELMVAATLTTAVISAAGYGVASMISTSTASTSRSERRAELSRSNDFIATEIREGSGIVKNTSTFTLPSASVTAFEASYSTKVTGTITKVLMVKPSATSTTPIIYFAATPSTGSWKGPRAIYRWGPAFNSTGGYSDEGTPSSWVSEAVVDQIQAASGTAPSCPTGSTANGDSGFYICVDSLGTTSTDLYGKSAQIFQNGKISKVLGASENYEVKMSAGSRKTSVTVAPASFALGAIASPFTVTGGEIIRTTAGNISATVLGSDWRGCTGAPAVKTSVKATVTVPAGSTAPAPQNITIDPAVGNYSSISFSNVPIGSKVSFVGNTPSNSCDRKVNGGNGWSSVSNPNQVVILKHGASVPANGGFGPNSVSAADYIKNYVVNGKISLPYPERQAIILFELGVTDPTQSGFDLQDIVLLADMGA